MIPYYLFLFLPLLSIFSLNKKSNIVFFNIYVFVLIFFIGLRYEVGGDWDNYYTLYLKINNYSFFEIFFLNKEPGFVLVNYILRILNLGFVSTNLFAAVIFIYGLYFVCVRQKYPWIGIIISIPYFIFVFSMGATKQSIATGFIFISFIHLADKKNIQFALFVLLASLFHYSAFFVFIFLFLNFKLNKKNISYLLIILSIIAIVFLPIFLKQYLAYITDKIQQTIAQGVYFRMVPALICSFLYIYLFNKRIFNYDDDKIWLMMSCLVIIFVLFSYNFSAAVDRFLYYFFILQIITISRIASLFKNTSNVLIFKLLIYLYSIIVFYIWFNFSNHYFMHVPYNLYLFIN